MTKKFDWRWIVGIYLVVVTVVLIIILFSLWPKEIPNKQNASLDATDNNNPKSEVITKDTVNSQINIASDSSKVIDSTIVVKSLSPTIPGNDLLYLILILGALGACLHGLTSLAEYIGNQNFQDSWILWYLLRPFVGGVLALVFYIVIRAGFLPQVESSGNFYLLAAVAGLTGLFSKQALYKLSDIFDTIFQSKKGEELKDKLIPGHPIPVIKNINPTTITVNSQKQSISVTGRQFIEGSIVKADDKDCKTEFKSSKNLMATLDDSWLKSATELEISVFNPEPGGGKSNSVKLTIA